MKLAIVSTTFLFTMMAAQAAVLPVAPATDVNLVKRTPNGDDETKQSPMAEERKGKSPAERTRIDAEIAPLRKELIVSAKQLHKMEEKRQRIIERYEDVKRAERLHDFDYIKKTYLSDWV
ncbi:hypothetical protein BASA50_005327 [Batrachochytrium salamandrivorans]|uniref:RxLR effector protein n=1 Tax=Batrachochytrium salamandrivorans TaxID=1357716 RepID=A0ABQ8FGF0_9FUNG|nr:hypothetical protein BASA50_005327 [Batrachochytrium salamandrivorans]